MFISISRANRKYEIPKRTLHNWKDSGIIKYVSFGPKSIRLVENDLVKHLHHLTK